jgi:hypothetical protein
MEEGSQNQLHPHLQQRLGTKYKFSKTEYVRLIEQALYRLGYKGVARQLEQDSVRGLCCSAILCACDLLWKP